MKTQHSLEEVAQFLTENEAADHITVEPLVEGHASQAFRYQTSFGSFVCRLSETDKDFYADQFAHDHFSADLPIPAIKTIGCFSGNTSYCISEFAGGKTTNILTDAELNSALTDIQHVLGIIYNMEINSSNGYGEIDLQTSNGVYQTWADKLREIDLHGKDKFKINATNIGVDESTIDKFMDQFTNNLPFASEKRRLLHGDPAFDNMLVESGHVTAIIDWAQMGYGDWMSDFARLDFWWPGRYGNAKAFAKSYGLDADNLDRRKALYWATNALWTIEFADKTKNDKVTQWLLDNIKSKLI